MTRETLNLLQKEIVQVLKLYENKQLITEASLAKKIRENTKMLSKEKAGIALQDIEQVLLFMEQNEAYQTVKFSLHCNSVHDLLLKKSTEMALLDKESRQRRLKSEKSITLLMVRDITEAKNEHQHTKKKLTKRTSRKKMNIYQNFEDE